jgi:hypothetical protein
MAKNRGGTLPPSGGALIGGRAPTPPAPARTAKGRTIDRLLSMLSIWPFRNKAFVRSLETAQEVVEKQNKLEETIIQHGRTRERLNDLEITIAQDRLQRRREFIEERDRFSASLNDSMLDGELMERRNKKKKKELTIEEIELKTRKARAKKEFEDFTKPVAPPPPEPGKKTTSRARSEKQKRRADAYKHYEKEIVRIEAEEGLSAKAKADLKKAAQNELEQELEKIEKMP